jgi:hypothetical protein
MKTAFILIFAAVLATACGNSEQTYKQPELINTKELTDIQWIDSTVDLGRINEGQMVEVVFRFRNTGKKPLVIRGVHPGCGCTVANPPAEPIAPGAEGEIKATFDSKGRPGVNHKSISVDANTNGSQTHEVSFNVEVIPQPKQ